MNAPSHWLFSDESNHNTGRFRSISLVSGEAARIQLVRTALAEILQAFASSEFRWTNVGGDRERRMAENFVETAFEATDKGGFRVDTLIWDTEDSRHKISLRDDMANLARMHYHLIRHVLEIRWPASSSWAFRPDHQALDWGTLHDTILASGRRTNSAKPRDLVPSSDMAKVGHALGLLLVEPSSSADEPLIQLADLFAGMASYSWQRPDDYRIWLSDQESARGQASLFDRSSEERPRVGRGAPHRAKVIHQVLDSSKVRNHRTSIREGGLRSYGGSAPINFWSYVPQRASDKAPTRAPSQSP